MPTLKRQTGYYRVKRNLPGIGPVDRSLRTDRKGVADARENALLACCRHGHQGVARAWLDGDVSIGRVHEAHATSTLPKLAQEIRQDDAPLSEAIPAALRDKAPDVAGSTLSRYETGLDHFRAFVGGDAGVREALTTGTVQEFKAHRLDVDDVAKQTVNNDLGAVSILCTYAERKGWIDERPEIKRFATSVRISYLEGDDLTAYFAELRPAFHPLMRLLIRTGMRLGEAEALTPADLRIGNGEARAAIEDAKTATGIRTVFIPQSAATALRAHVEREGRGKADPIFQIARRTVQAEHNRVRKRIGRPEYTIHDHRHTAAVHLARAGMPLHLLQQQLGHANIDQTMRYARFHPDYGDVAEYFDRVDRRLGVGDGDEDTSRDLDRAAELLGMDADDLARIVASEDVEVAA